MKNFIKLILKFLRKSILRSSRERKLANILSHQIKLLKKTNRELNILDYGSGFEPEVIKLILKNLKNDYKKININCCDFYTRDQVKRLNKKFENKISFFHVDKLKLLKNKYDISICADVLHHVGVENLDNIEKILKFLNYNSKYVIIKDHYEHSKFPRQILRFMDFIGNYYNDVSIPKKYFTHEMVNNLIKRLNLKKYREINNYSYYSNFFLFFSNPKLHFILILKE